MQRIMKKNTFNRRGFMGLAGAGMAAATSVPWLRATAAAETISPRDADLVVFNAKVYTIDSSAPQAQAFAVRGNRFIAVGSTEEIKGLIGKGTQTFDAQQMTIVPGFAD